MSLSYLGILSDLYALHAAEVGFRDRWRGLPEIYIVSLLATGNQSVFRK